MGLINKMAYIGSFPPDYLLFTHPKFPISF